MIVRRVPRIHFRALALSRQDHLSTLHTYLNHICQTAESIQNYHEFVKGLIKKEREMFREVNLTSLVQYVLTKNALCTHSHHIHLHKLIIENTSIVFGVLD